jgi:hypothetical protein
MGHGTGKQREMTLRGAKTVLKSGHLPRHTSGLTPCSKGVYKVLKAWSRHDLRQVLRLRVDLLKTQALKIELH